MSDELLKWRDGAIRAAGIVFSLVFVFLYLIYICLVGVTKNQRLAPKPVLLYSDDVEVEILRRTSELPDLSPPPDYEVVKEAPPPAYHSVVIKE